MSLTDNAGTGQQEMNRVRGQEGDAQQQSPARGDRAQTWPLPPILPAPPLTSPQRLPIDSQKEDDSRVGHGISQPQDAAPHDGVAEVEHGHSK